MSETDAHGRELEEIRRKYESGQLEPIRQDLERFILAHRQEIALFRADQEKRGLALSDEATVKLFLLRHRTINPRREIEDQLEEIQKEKWIQGVRTGRSPDAQEVALDWARNHSAGWRAHRLTTIVYVFDREKEMYCRLLGGGSAHPA
jgi:hypothetical protein